MKERVKRAVRKVFRLQENPPIVIYGPGGMGKSALIARFIWEHATIPDARFPFVYLDFDRVSLRADEPLTLLAEAVRQLGLQYAETRVFADRVRSGWQSELISRSAESVTSISSQGGTTAQASAARSAESDWQRYVRDFASLLAHVRQGSQPCLFVLDTFEEAQRRGSVVEPVQVSRDPPGGRSPPAHRHRRTHPSCPWTAFPPVRARSATSTKPLHSFSWRSAASSRRSSSGR